MAKDPARRFSSAAAMAAALGETVSRPPRYGHRSQRRPVLDRGPVCTDRASTGRDRSARFGSLARNRWQGLRRRPGAALAVILVAVFVFVVVLATRNGDSRSTPTGKTSPTTLAGSPGGSLPEPLDRAIKSLEEAVRP